MSIIRNEELLYAQKKINLEIEEISYARLNQSWRLQNLRAAFTRIYFPLSGMGRITVGDRVIELLPENVYIIPAGLNFCCECPSLLEKIYVHLNLTHPNGSDALSGISSCLILPDQKERIETLRSLYESREITAILRFKLLLYEILLEAMAQAPSENAALKDYSPITKSALAYVDAHLSASLTIHDIASAIFVSKLLLQKNFKEDLGRPLGQYIDDRIMAKAERSLLDESRSIKEISDALGFCDQFYFSRRFSQTHGGTAPLRFRQIHRNA